eukprot:m51a1_g1651 hypothetical protein (388) ;mRNA; f:346772-348486
MSDLKHKKGKIHAAMDKLKTLNEKRARAIVRAMTEEPFLSLVDKFSFISGVCLLLVTQHVMLVMPHKFHVLYLCLVGPLIAFRWASYHTQKWHYFLLDFCYFCHVMLVAYLAAAKYTGSPCDAFFQIVFAFANGPLIIAIPAWHNSLVFHDVDKLTSLAIHIFPALETYSLRWDAGVGGAASFTHSFLWPLGLYALWQLLYLLFTEVFRKEKIRRCGYMTSLRWLSEERPHPILLWTRGKGWKTSPLWLLVGVQLVYTVATLLPIALLLSSRTAHTLYVAALFVWAVWNGACFYFDAFASVYAKRIAARKAAATATSGQQQQQQHREDGRCVHEEEQRTRDGSGRDGESPAASTSSGASSDDEYQDVLDTCRPIVVDEAVQTTEESD